jgi:Ca2+:H+ antiporter
LSNISTGKIDLVGAALRSSANKEDDEVEVRDLGVELIRRRQEERRARKKKEQLERKRRLAVDGTTPEASAPTTGQPDDTFAAQQSRSLGPITDRSVSRTRAASATRGPDSRAPSEGYFAPFAGSVMGSDTPRDPMLSPKDELRAPSIHSSTAEDDEDAAHERASILDEVVQEVVEDELVAGGEDEDAEDEETSGDGEEGVTLKDRQDVSF